MFGAGRRNASGRAESGRPLRVDEHGSTGRGDISACWSSRRLMQMIYVHRYQLHMVVARQHAGSSYKSLLTGRGACAAATVLHEPYVSWAMAHGT